MYVKIVLTFHLDPNQNCGMGEDFSSFLKLVDELRKRGAVEIESGETRVRFLGPYQDISVSTAAVRDDKDGNKSNEVPIEFWSSS